MKNPFRRKKKTAPGAPDMIERRSLSDENVARRVAYDAAANDVDKAAARASLDMNAVRTAQLRKTIQVLTIERRHKAT